MGTKMAPLYANIFIATLEKHILQTVSLKPFLWRMLIDDIDMNWIHGREALEAFFETANNFHSTIRFAARVSSDSDITSR